MDVRLQMFAEALESFSYLVTVDMQTVDDRNKLSHIYAPEDYDY